MILITRPMPEAQETADLLKGRQTLCAPMLMIEPVLTQQVDDFHVALFTSGNGVRHVDDFIVKRQPQVLTVGDATAELARQRGFEKVRSAQGNVDDLFSLAKEILDPNDKAIHFCGATHRGNLVGRLNNAGFNASQIHAYKALEMNTLPEETISALMAKRVRSALFFSPRTATVFMKNLNNHGLIDCLSEMTAFCISPAVANQLPVGQWNAVKIAKRPTQSALFELIYDQDR